MAIPDLFLWIWEERLKPSFSIGKSTVNNNYNAINF